MIRTARRLCAFALTLTLALILCLPTGCGEGKAPGAPSPVSPAPPPESVPEPEAAPEDPAPAVLPQEDPERPGDLAGADGYYAPGNRLTLYAMEPGTGELRVVRENDFWNGREPESVSPSGDRLLLSSWDGAPSRRVVSLSLYDMEEDRLVNLSRTIEAPCGTWEDSHWFPGRSGYAFVGEDTFYYRGFCAGEDPARPHLHRYTIGEDGRVTADFLELECPSRQPDWESDCILLPEKRQVFCHLRVGEDAWVWLTWDLDSGRLLSRAPGNGWARDWDVYRDGVFYTIESDPEAGAFRLTAYHMDTDTAQVLASGAIPKTPGMEEEPWDSRGALEDVWIEELRDGVFRLRSTDEFRENRARESYREALWEPSMGDTIAMGERRTAPTFPVDPALGYLPVFTASPEGDGLYLPLPPEMAGYYRDSGRPYPLARLSTGEILFLAKTAPLP